MHIWNNIGNSFELIRHRVEFFRWEKSVYIFYAIFKLNFLGISSIDFFFLPKLR